VILFFVLACMVENTSAYVCEKESRSATTKITIFSYKLASMRG